MRPWALGILYRQEGLRRLGVRAEETCFLQTGRKAVRGIALNHREFRDGQPPEQISDGNRLEPGKSLFVYAISNGDRLKVAAGQQLRLGKNQSLIVRNDFQRGLRCKRVQRNKGESRQDPFHFSSRNVSAFRAPFVSTLPRPFAAPRH